MQLAMDYMDRYVSRAFDETSLVTRRIAGETILVPVARNVGDLDAVYTLNEVGSFVWRLIDGRRSGRAIAEEVTAGYEIDFERAAVDVGELLNALESRGLVRLSSEPKLV